MMLQNQRGTYLRRSHNQTISYLLETNQHKEMNSILTISYLLETNEHKEMNSLLTITTHIIIRINSKNNDSLQYKTPITHTQLTIRIRIIIILLILNKLNNHWNQKSNDKVESRKINKIFFKNREEARITSMVILKI